MTLRFDSGDEKGFARGRDTVLAGFERWLRTVRGLSEADAERTSQDAAVALNWKWSYGDGDLASWSEGDLLELLLEWCPRKLSVPPSESGTIPAAIAALLRYLADERMLATGPVPAEGLADLVESLTDEFLTAMADSSRFGLAKTLFTVAWSEGVDLTDASQLQGWMDDFNSRPEEERRRLIPDRPGMGGMGGTDVSAPRRMSFPPVALPLDEEVAASRAEAPVLAKLAALAAFVGDGRTLTKKGNFTLADARALVDLLGTGDRVEEIYGERTIRIQSAVELRGLRQLFRWARKAGVLRVSRGKVIATKLGKALATDPGQHFDRVVDALFALGPLESCRHPRAWPAYRAIESYLDESAVGMLAVPYVAQQPVAFDDLAEAAAAGVQDAFEFSGEIWTGDFLARMVADDIADMVDTLELAGVLRREGTETQDLIYRIRRVGGTVELTAAGVVTVRRLLERAGYGVPVTGRLAEVSAMELLLEADGDDFDDFAGELETWKRRRDPEQAMAELADAVRALEDPALRATALAIMSEIGVDVAAPFVRQLAAERSSKGFALCWLVDHGFEAPEALFDPSDLQAFVDVLATRLVGAGAEGLVDTLSLSGDHAQQVNAIAGMWRSPSAATYTVLGVIGASHPTKAVSKAARKAVLQRRSWLANR